MSKKTAKELIKKYTTGKSENEMVKEQEKLETDYKIACSEMETEIRDFSTTIDELKNPKTDKLMCKVRRPTTSEWRRLIPKNITKYQGRESEIPIEEAREYEDLVYELMANLIVQPTDEDGNQRTAKWWKENTSYEFVYLFQEHLMKVFDEMEKKVGNFLEQK